MHAAAQTLVKVQYNTIFFYCSRRQTAVKVTYTMTRRPMIV